MYSGYGRVELEAARSPETVRLPPPCPPAFPPDKAIPMHR